MSVRRQNRAHSTVAAEFPNRVKRDTFAMPARCPFRAQLRTSCYFAANPRSGPQGDITFLDHSASAMGHESRNVVPIEISQKSVRGGIGKF